MFAAPYFESTSEGSSPDSPQVRKNLDKSSRVVIDLTEA
jgi:hypothetical protein